MKVIARDFLPGIIVAEGTGRAAGDVDDENPDSPRVAFAGVRADVDAVRSENDWYLREYRDNWTAGKVSEVLREGWLMMGLLCERMAERARGRA